MTDAVRYEFGASDDGAVAFGLSAAQIGIVVGTGLVVIGATRVGVPLWLVALVAAPVAGFGVGRWQGERLTAVTVRWLAWLLRPRSGTHAPLAAVATSDGDGATAVVQRAEVAPPVWAGRLQLLRVPYGDGGEVGVWLDGDAYATVLAVRAPATALRDLSEQEGRLTHWGDVLASAGSEGSMVQRVGWVARSSPDQGAGAATWLREHGDSTVRLSSVWRSYVEVGEQAGSAAATRELLVTLRVQPDRARRRLRGLRGEDRTLAAAQLALGETERVGARLVELGCHIEGLLTPEALAAVVRTGLDVAARDDLAWWSAAGGADGVDPDTGMWPLSWEETADHVRTDGGFHRLAWVEEWPTVPVLATWMHPLLLRSSCTRTLSVIMEPVATHTAVRSTQRARASAVSEAEVRRRHGFIASLRTERSMASAEQREQELIDGHRDMRFAGYVCVSAKSLDALEEGWAATVYEAGQARLRLRALHGEHWPALAAVLPLGRFH